MELNLFIFSYHHEQTALLLVELLVLNMIDEFLKILNFDQFASSLSQIFQLILHQYYSSDLSIICYFQFFL